MRSARSDLISLHIPFRCLAESVMFEFVPQSNDFKIKIDPICPCRAEKRASALLYKSCRQFCFSALRAKVLAHRIQHQLTPIQWWWPCLCLQWYKLLIIVRFYHVRDMRSNFLLPPMDIFLWAKACVESLWQPPLCFVPFSELIPHVASVWTRGNLIFLAWQHVGDWKWGPLPPVFWLGVWKSL